jgi:glutaminyl-tRNA synthetase
MAAIIVEHVIPDGRPMPAAGHLISLARLLENRDIDSDSVPVLLDMLAGGGEDPQESRPTARECAREAGLLLDTDASDLEPVIRRTVREHPDEWRRYVAGKDGLLGFFVGRVLGALDTPADPALVSGLIEKMRRSHSKHR